MKSRVLKPISCSLRRKQTEAENSLWFYLRARRFQGIKFRRQLPIEAYVAYFCSPEEKIIIELDGSQHSKDQDRDAARTKFMESEGFRVFRFWDNEVFVNIDGVLEYIRQQIKSHPHPGPLPSRERGES